MQVDCCCGIIGVSRRKNMKVIGTLTRSLHKEGSSTGEPSSWVTFRDAKGQIRAFCRKAGIKATGTFRPRRENRGELMIHVDGGTVSARRKPGAEVVFNTLITRDVADLSPEVLATILAQG